MPFTPSINHSAIACIPKGESRKANTITHMQLFSIQPVTNMTIASKPKMPDITVRIDEAKQKRKRVIAPNRVSTIINGIAIILPIIFIVQSPFLKNIS